MTAKNAWMFKDIVSVTFTFLFRFPTTAMTISCISKGIQFCGTAYTPKPAATRPRVPMNLLGKKDILRRL